MFVSDIIGIIYPIPKQFIDQLLKVGKNVFVKYIQGQNIKLKKNNKLIIYESYGTKKLVGEGIIKKIEFLTAEEVYDKYPDKLFLNKKELYDYCGELRKDKKMLTLLLDNIIKYEKDIYFNKPITMAGQYITKEQYHNSIRKRLFIEQS